jgi:glutamate racemase
VPRAALARRVSWLIAKGGADLTLVACNAASAVLAEVETEHPVMGLIESGLELALEARHEPIGILAGNRVITDETYARPLRAEGRMVRESSGQALSALVERGETSGAAVTEAATHALEPLTEVATVLLGCTHYPALIGTLATIAPHATWLDPMPRMLDAAIKRHGLMSALGDGTQTTFTSGNREVMRRAAQSVYGAYID